jgi:hypothetical protein
MGSIVLFSDGRGDVAAVYMHGDDGDVPEQLDGFFAREESRMSSLSGGRYSNRFDDAEYLAARFVHHLSSESGDGVGITTLNRRDETNYRVLCTQETWPRVATL